jgi:hypothetical protein
MNHSEAIEATAVAAYLRGELSGAERDAFEFHVIDCPDCAQAVWTGSKAAADVPPISQPQRELPPPLPFRQRARQWLATAAAAVFAFVLGGQMLTSSAPLPAFSIADPGGSISGIKRGRESETLKVHFNGDRQVEIIVTITSEGEPFPAYQLELVDGSGKVLHQKNLTPEEALHIDSVALLLNPLPVGRYVLTSYGVRKDGNRLELVATNLVVQ